MMHRNFVSGDSTIVIHRYRYYMNRVADIIIVYARS